MAIDDLGLALDIPRQAHFRDKLQKLGQVFITTPSPPVHFTDPYQIHIKSGSLAI